MTKKLAKEKYLPPFRGASAYLNVFLGHVCNPKMHLLEYFMIYGYFKDSPLHRHNFKMIGACVFKYTLCTILAITDEIFKNKIIHCYILSFLMACEIQKM